VTSSLEIQIDSAGLSEIYGAGQSITLALKVGQIVDAVASPKASAGGAGQLIVAWLAFAPLETNVSWSEQYYCFATATPLTIGEVIKMNSQGAAPMQPGSVCTFANGQFSSHPGSGSTYVIYNATAGSYGFGLAQQATVDDVPVFAPTSAVPVLFNEAGYFTPGNQVSIFLSSASNNGTLIPPPINALALAVDTARAVVAFNDQTHSFFQLS
jgi:hypothetical protein